MKQYKAYEYILIDMANQYGKAGTFEAQIKWAYNTIGVKGREHAETLVKSAKHPARYLAAILGWEDYVAKRPSGYLVGLDASASGCQVMAALIGCKTTAKNTGLTGKFKKDIYTITTNYMNKILGKKKIWDRAVVKSAMMPFFYGSKRMPKVVFGAGTDEYAAFHQAVLHTAPGACRLMKVMQSCWQPYATEHTWVMPDGFTVRVPVTQVVQDKILIPELDDEITYQHTVIQGEEKGISLAAHITHSVDSYIMREVVERCPFEMLVIHDEYLAHPNNMNAVRQAYADVMAEVTNNNLLDTILSQIVGEGISIEKEDDIGKLSAAIKQGEYAIN